MDKVFLLLLSAFDAELQQVSWCFVASKKTTKVAKGADTSLAPEVRRGSGTLEEFVSIHQSHFPAAEVVVVISGQYLTYTDVAPTVKNQKQMLQALPYLVEEQVIGDIEDMHIVVPENITLADDKIRIAIIDKGALHKLKELLSHYKLAVNEIVGLPDLLSCETDELHILLDDDFAIVKNSKICFQCDQHDLETMLELVSLENTSSIKVSLHEINKNSLSLAKKIKTKFSATGIKIQSSPFAESTLDYMVGTGDTRNFSSLNILQGDISLAGSRNKKLYQFLPLAWVAVLCVFMQIAFNIAAGWYFKRLSDLTNKNAAALYLQLFPEDKKVVNLAAQFAAKTNSSAFNVETGRFPIVFSSTIDAMRGVGKPTDITLKQFRYDESSGELKVGLDTNAIALLDKVKEKLAERGLIVDIISANEENGTIKATLSIKNS